MVLLTEHGDDLVVQEALRVGIHGLLVKAQGLDDLIQAIREVSGGAIHVSARCSPILLSAFTGNRKPRPSQLMLRELHTLRLICDGKTMKEAAVVMVRCAIQQRLVVSQQ